MAAAGIGPQARTSREAVVSSPDPKDAVRAATAATNGPFLDANGADGVGPERTVTLDYVDDRGRRWVGEFRVKVLSIRDRINLGLTKARMAGGIPLASLDPQTDLLLEIVAHLSIALVQRPKWAEDLYALYDQGVLGALYREVSDHEVRFHGADGEDGRDVDGGGA